ncbi:hypothetical protein [Bradyrhizobium sp. AS23.2]|uniref:hypothetical protein n=1 Tax=Bradyrhizobium sp. AS23.2 TaxID=1680155 RepID=UPI00093BB247|nr:hypothetical protein [Bradyrhizobium sp. AS23.2]OKO86818.1 hypothetical protein AC630_01865 [Bradyrhizobium sp. AS23.2]
MCDTKEAEGLPGLFVSAKTTTAIPVRHPALREALIQLSLDPQVRSIEYVASIDAIVIQHDDDRDVLDVVPARAVRDIDEEGLVLIALGELELKPLVLTAEEIRREPRRTNANLIWSHKDVTVAIALRMRILQVLLDEGPMPLGQLIKALAGESDPAAAVMALACANLVHLDLSDQPLSPTTLVRYSVQAD